MLTFCPELFAAAWMVVLPPYSDTPMVERMPARLMQAFATSTPSWIFGKFWPDLPSFYEEGQHVPFLVPPGRFQNGLDAFKMG